jgi:hypothetical protein
MRTVTLRPPIGAMFTVAHAARDASVADTHDGSGADAARATAGRRAVQRCSRCRARAGGQRCLSMMLLRPSRQELHPASITAIATAEFGKHGEAT